MRAVDEHARREKVRSQVVWRLEKPKPSVSVGDIVRVFRSCALRNLEQFICGVGAVDGHDERAFVAIESRRRSFAQWERSR
jgi:hypothetical protein